jgi:hypothetical protein
MYQQGEDYIFTAEERKMQADINAGYETLDPVELALQDKFMIDPNKPDWKTHTFTILQIVDANLKGSSQANARAIAAVLNSKCGLAKSKNMRVDGKLAKGYEGITLRSEAEQQLVGIRCRAETDMR